MNPRKRMQKKDEMEDTIPQLKSAFRAERYDFPDRKSLYGT
jgi:hypothetical protein